MPWVAIRAVTPSHVALSRTVTFKHVDCHHAVVSDPVDHSRVTGGVPFHADDLGVDCAYSGSQKVLSGPPGGAPFMLSERAMQKILNRHTKVASYYLDMTLVGDYWGWFNKRWYHHTGALWGMHLMQPGLSPC